MVVFLVWYAADNAGMPDVSSALHVHVATAWRCLGRRADRCDVVYPCITAAPAAAGGAPQGCIHHGLLHLHHILQVKDPEAKRY
jgi:hypothetical protein